jgi:hypothetical protein
VQSDHQRLVAALPLGGEVHAVSWPQQRRPAVGRLPIAVVGRSQGRRHDDQGITMHDASVAPAALQARRGPPEALAQALRAARADTLRLFAAFERHLPGLQVPQRAELNPPLWELGHIGWFQAHWIERLPLRQRVRGAKADPADHPGSADDALYDSSRVPHATRWRLPLPEAGRIRAQLAQQLQATLALLNEAAHEDDALYVFRLALLHDRLADSVAAALELGEQARAGLRRHERRHLL